LDVGLSDKKEGLAALGWEKELSIGSVGLQAGALVKMDRSLDTTWYVGGTWRF